MRRTVMRRTRAAEMCGLDAGRCLLYVLSGSRVDRPSGRSPFDDHRNNFARGQSARACGVAGGTHIVWFGLVWL